MSTGVAGGPRGLDWMAARVDTLIVGGGSAGCVLAARLSDDPQRQVVLLEAGADYPDHRPGAGAGPARPRRGADASTSWPRWTGGSMRPAPRTGPRMAIPRGRVMGGSGAINGTIFLRGTPEDFESWATLVGPEWGWDQIAPAYRAIEADPFGADADHGRSGPGAHLPLAGSRLDPDPGRVPRSVHRDGLRRHHRPQRARLDGRRRAAAQPARRGRACRPRSRS